MVAAAWVLYVWFAGDRDGQRLGFATGDKGLRIARALYGLALIPFGLAHFVYLEETTCWCLAGCDRPWPGRTSPALPSSRRACGAHRCVRTAGSHALGVAAGRVHAARVGAPRAAGHVSAFQWGEVVVTVALTAAAWVVADSYRGMPWLSWAYSPEGSR